MLSTLTWVSGCSSTGSGVDKPDSALTLPMQYEERDADDTPRSLLKKFEFNLKELLDGNRRFEDIRD